MGFQVLEDIINIAKDVGGIHNVALIDNRDVFVQGITDDGKAYEFSFKLKEKEQENA